jgi:hypothetical protein
MVKLITANGSPSLVTTTPADPFTSTGRSPAAMPPGSCRIPVTAWLATAAGPRTSIEGSGALGARVDPQHDAGVEQRDERVEVALASRGEKGVDGLSLAGEVGGGGYLGAPHAAASPAGELLGRGRGPAQQGADLPERQAEQVMQDERQPFVRGKCVEDD